MKNRKGIAVKKMPIIIAVTVLVLALLMFLLSLWLAAFVMTGSRQTLEEAM